MSFGVNWTSCDYFPSVCWEHAWFLCGCSVCRQAAQREETYEETIRDLTERLKDVSKRFWNLLLLNPTHDVGLLRQRIYDRVRKALHCHCLLLRHADMIPSYCHMTHGVTRGGVRRIRFWMRLYSQQVTSGEATLQLTRVVCVELQFMGESLYRIESTALSALQRALVHPSVTHTCRRVCLFRLKCVR